MITIRQEIKNIIWIALFTAGFVWLSVYMKSEKEPKKDAAVTTVVQEQNVQTKDVEKWLLALPNSPFKSNMLVVFAAEYGGSSQELNNLLQAFAEIKIQESK